MARSRALRLAFLTLSNVLIPIAVLVFATGFFPYKPFLPGLATFEDVHIPGAGNPAQATHPEAMFDRVVFMVVDALRSDFVFGSESGFQFTQSLIRSGAAIPFTAHATPPTVTMPRVKALTTGSVPSFLDLILNFAESDTSSSLGGQDTWLAQIKAAGAGGKGGTVVFYGDDTWLKLFPGESWWLRAEGTSSFFVSDFTEVDNNVTRHLGPELARSDWNALVLHYLGLDHIGHKTGPQGPNMLPKQREMDGLVQQVYGAMETYEHHERTLFVLVGDHGMNAGGNHGGSGPGETEPALVFASPVFKETMVGKGGMEGGRRKYECPTQPKEGTEFHYYTKIEQSDIVPALAGMLGVPVSKNNLGVLPRELGVLWRAERRVELLRQNAMQLLHIVRAKYGGEAFDRAVEACVIAMGANSRCGPAGDDEERLVSRWAEVLRVVAQHANPPDYERVEEVLYGFLELAQETMSDTASSYDIPRMVIGMATVAGALVLAILAFPSLWPPSVGGIFLTVTSLLYGIMMFASSYVEEEQHFWYWLFSAWTFILLATCLCNTPSTSSKTPLRIATAGFILFCTHRLAVRWNQTGQKHAGEPDIVHTVFPEYHIIMWLLTLAAYLVNGYFLHTRTFTELFMPEVAALTVTSLVLFAVVFKLNFTQADAPELVQGLALRIREWSEPFSLVLQARAAFASIALAAVAVVVLAYVYRQRQSNQQQKTVSLSERLHHLLTLFLMTQTRAPNVPLFLALELQRLALGWLLSVARNADSKHAGRSRPSAVQAAVGVLLLSHVYFFCLGGSNSISSIDLSNAYNGVADYNIAAVGVLLFASNWGGPIWWCSAAVLLCTQRPANLDSSAPNVAEVERDWVMVEREKLHEDAVASTKVAGRSDPSEAALDEGVWFVYVASMTTFVATALLAVMAACTALRTHLFIWTVFSPKYLYALAWSLGWHLLLNVGMGSLLYRLSSI